VTRSTVGPKFHTKFGPKFGREFGRVRGPLALAGVAVLAIACESDPEPIAPEDDQIVAARLDRARFDSNPIDATERDSSREDDSIPTATDEAARLEAMRAMLESTPTASSTGSEGSGAGAGGDGASGSQGSGAGDAPGGSDGGGEGESTGGSDGGGEGESTGGSDGCSGSDGGASGGSSGSGSSTGAGGGSAGESGATATGAPSNAGGAASGTGSSGTAGDASGGASGTGSESAGAAPSSGETSTGSSGSNGGPTTAGGAGRGGGVGDTGTTTDRSTDFIQGVGGASGDAAGTGRGDPGFIEPEAMEGAGTRLPGGGGAAGAGSGEAFDAAGGAGGGGRSGGGGRDGGAAGGESSVAIDGEIDGETDVETEAPTGVLEPGASSIDPEAPNERDDFLDAPVVLDLPTTPDAGPEGLESSEAATEREGEDPRGGTGGAFPPTAVSPSPESGVDGRREDAAVEGAVGDSGADETGPDEPDAASEPVPTTAPENASDRDPALDPDVVDEAIPLRERLAVPQVDLAPIETTLERREARSKEPPRDDPAWLLRGAWEQLDRDLDGPDFAPGGFERNVVAIDPREGTLEVYRLYRGGLVVAGAVRAEFLPEGTLLLSEDDGLPHRFPRERLELADGVAVEPPIEPVDLDRRWSLRNGVLEIEGRRFTRIDREAFERIARGDATGSTDGASTIDGSTAPVLAVDDPADVDADSAATASVDFFGTSIVGRYICYVVDISGSMAGPRLAAALDELARSIRALPPDRSFHVLFFSGGTLVLEDRWQRATSGRKRAFTSRFADIEAQGGTEPRGALEHAFTKLAPVPDEIHFMTDGQIPGNVVQQLRDLNGGRIRSVIHTYAFGDASGGAVLERIAGEHGGQYRFVPDRP